MERLPECVVIFSGKRKSGKDFITELTQSRLGSKCAILRLSEPLKRQYAKDHGLNLEQLLGASEYKEKYRADMIRWGEEKRNADPAYFCHLVTTSEGSEKPIWIISDARRCSDLHYFEKRFQSRVILVRVVAEEEVRQRRGWKFTQGIDDAESECDLDGVTSWNYIIHNNNTIKDIEQDLDSLVHQIQGMVS